MPPLAPSKSGGRYGFVTGHRPGTQAERPLSISANSHSPPRVDVQSAPQVVFEKHGSSHSPPPGLFTVTVPQPKSAHSESPPLPCVEHLWSSFPQPCRSCSRGRHERTEARLYRFIATFA